MRLIHVSVAQKQLQTTRELLEERELGYTVTDQTDGTDGQALVSFLIPADGVEHVLTALDEAGVDTETYTVSVETEFAVFDHVDEVQDRWAGTPNKIAPAALRSKAKDMRLNTRSYLWMMLLSTIVATAGLLIGSPAIVVGSMVIAPIVSPMMTAGVGAVRDDRKMVLDSLYQQGIGLFFAIVGALLFAAAVRFFFAVPASLDIPSIELISIRLSPGVLSIAVGLAAGTAGAFGLATKGRVTIVGVMIAAALIPTAAAAGIALAWGELVVGAGSLALLLLTIIAVNLGAALMLLYLGYRPDDVGSRFFAVDSARSALVIGVTIVAVIVVVSSVGLVSYQQVSFEQSANSATTDVLDRSEYDGIDVTSINARLVADPMTERTTVMITLSRTDGAATENLPNVLADAIAERTGEEVVVQLEYRDLYRSTPESEDANE